MIVDSIIFDVDGTLWDSTDVVADAWNMIIKKHTKQNSLLTGDRLKSLFGKTMDAIAASIFENESKKRQLELIELCGNFENEYLQTHCGTIYPHMEYVLKELSTRYPLYIVSNCQAGYIETFLSATGFECYFKDYLCPGDTGEGKAYNISQIITRNQLSAPVYIGDTLGDYHAVKEANSSIPFIFASYGFGTVEHAEYTITDPLDLLTIL